MHSNIATFSATHCDRLPFPVIACGAYLKNRACLIDGCTVKWSDMHGNLVTTGACLALENTIQSWCSEVSTPVGALAHDLHPDFYSSHLATATAMNLGVPSMAVQHHHAHIASVIAERDVNRRVIGVALDGMGVGTDNGLWGGELLLVEGGTSAHQWRRLAHLPPIALPGGEHASREPWRLAASVLHKCGCNNEIVNRFAPYVGESASVFVASMLEKQVNCPASSSCGRWFDAAAGALGVSIHQTQEAQAAIAIEQLAAGYLNQHPAFDWPWQSLDLYPIVRQLFDCRSVAQGAAVFHLALVNGLANTIAKAAVEHECKDIVLAGGCFANRILVKRLDRVLQSTGYQVYTPANDRYGDDGLALGQAWIARCQLLEELRSSPLFASTC